MVSLWLISNGLFLGNTSVNIQLVTFLLFNVSELCTELKTKKSWQPSSPVKYILSNQIPYSFLIFDIRGVAKLLLPAVWIALTFFN